MIRLLYCILVILPTSMYCQTKAEIYGRVYEKTTNEPILGALIYTNNGLSTESNEFGFYKLSLIDMPNNVVYFTSIGYDTDSLKLNQGIQAINVDIYLQPISYFLNTVEVAASRIERKPISSLDMLSISAKDLKQHQVTILGENDLLKTLQIFPGIARGNEGNSALLVRGGGPDQNQFLLDNFEIINPFHLGGLLSVFDTDIIKNVDIYKGGFPAKYSGKASSIIDSKMNDGRADKWEKKLTIGSLTSKLFLQGPLKNKKTTSLINIRRSTLDILYKGLSTISNNPAQSDFYIYDVNFKIIHKFSAKNEIALNYYRGIDNLQFNNVSSGSGSTASNKSESTWGNNMLGISHNFISKNMSIKNLISYADYNNSITGLSSIENSSTNFSSQGEYMLASSIKNLTLKSDHKLYYSEDLVLNYGINILRQTFTPGASFKEQANTGISIDSSQFTTLESNVINTYLASEKYFTSKLKLVYGLNTALFLYQREGFNKLYFQPRLKMSYALNKDWNIDAAYTRVNQFSHLLSSNGTGLPIDSWVPATNIATPPTSDIISTGVRYGGFSFLELSLEGYYKRISDMIFYSEGSSFVSRNLNFESNILTEGNARSYGAEFFVNSTFDRFNGLVSYTLAKSELNFPGLNEANWFPNKFDRLHNLSVSVSYQKSRSTSFNILWVYTSGSKFTALEQQFSGLYYDRSNPNGYALNPTERYGSINANSLPAYHRLDINFRFKKENNGVLKREWLLGIYNLYNRINPYFIYTVGEGDTIAYKKFGLFPILPSVAYNRYF